MADIGAWTTFVNTGTADALKVINQVKGNTLNPKGVTVTSGDYTASITSAEAVAIVALIIIVILIVIVAVK